MKVLNEKELERIRREYPASTRIKLLSMPDDPLPPPIGSLGTVTGVNCFGDLEVKWDCGSSLSVIYHVDQVEKI